MEILILTWFFFCFRWYKWNEIQLKKCVRNVYKYFWIIERLNKKMEAKQNTIGAVLVVEDNKGDQIIFKEAFLALGIVNEIVVVNNGKEAFTYLKGDDVQPILILCDINMPELNGLQLREEIFNDKKLRIKCIPFIFMSSDGSEDNIEKAFEYSVQGYFEKAKDFHSAVELLNIIIKYWKTSKLPNNKFVLLKELEKR